MSFAYSAAQARDFLQGMAKFGVVYLYAIVEVDLYLPGGERVEGFVLVLFQFGDHFVGFFNILEGSGFLTPGGAGADAEGLQVVFVRIQLGAELA